VLRKESEVSNSIIQLVAGFPVEKVGLACWLTHRSPNCHGDTLHSEIANGLLESF